MSVQKTKWDELTPSSLSYFFVPRNEKLQSKFLKYLSVQKIFPVNSVGIVTARDSFVIDDDEKALKRLIEQFSNENQSDAFIRQTFA